jgi:peptidoglycan/xylan/chitin deacetylase (PgdA/CDA1 family)
LSESDRRKANNETRLVFRNADATSVRRSLSVIFYDRLHVLQYQMPFAERSLLDKGAVIFSIDIDVGHEEVGLVNQGKNDGNVSNTRSERQIGRVEQTALPLILDLFDSFEMPATFAVRGQLFDVSPATVEPIAVSPIKHDIGGHGYYHRSFTALTRSEASLELTMLHDAMRKFGLQPKSFVFPRNKIEHLDLLLHSGYLCFRGSGGFPHNRMLIDRVRGLWNVHPTLFVHSGSDVAALTEIVDICSRKKSPAHLWFHPWNFGSRKSEIENALTKVLRPLLAHVRKLESHGSIAISSMREIADHAERSQMARVERNASSIWDS